MDIRLTPVRTLFLLLLATAIVTLLAICCWTAVDQLAAEVQRELDTAEQFLLIERDYERGLAGR